MSRKLGSVFACLYGLAMLVLCALPVGAQMSEVKAKPPMYTYVADWQIPRAHWGEMAQANAADKPILDKALADGTIVGYGNDEDLVHVADGSTHDDWWSAMSMAGLIKVLDRFYASGNTSSPALDSATKHWDTIFISRYYNWHSGSYKGGYTSISSYKLKPDAPDDAVGMISEHMVAPLLEKMLADGTILEYEIDTLAVHTEAPGTFWISYVAAEPEGLDKVDAAIRDTLKDHPLDGPAFASMVDFSAHRDALIKGDGTYK
jgi:hypothetical protein